MLKYLRPIQSIHRSLIQTPIFLPFQNRIMATYSTTTRFATLDAFWVAVDQIQTTSTNEEWEKLAGYFADDAVLYVLGMSSPPVTGKAAAIESFKTLKTYWALVERRQRSQSLSADGKVAVVEMDNHLTIFGEHVEHFPETEVVEFDEAGKIASYRLYCDGTPLKEIAAKKMAAQ